MECDEGTEWAKKAKAKHASLGNPPPPPGQAYSCCGIPDPDADGGAEGGTDAKSRGSGGFTQCKKVYHAYCMGFALGDDELGSCPRHACLDCGLTAKHYCR